MGALISHCFGSGGGRGEKEEESCFQRTDWVVFQHAQRRRGTRTRKKVREARHGHGDEAHCNNARLDYLAARDNGSVVKGMNWYFFFFVFFEGIAILVAVTVTHRRRGARLPFFAMAVGCGKGGGGGAARLKPRGGARDELPESLGR